MAILSRAEPLSNVVAIAKPRISGKGFVQTDEEVQENIGVSATERMKDPQGKPTARKERSTKGKMKRRNKAKRGWKNRKIPTEGLSKGDKVQLIYQQLGAN